MGLKFGFNFFIFFIFYLIIIFLFFICFFIFYNLINLFSTLFHHKPTSNRIPQVIQYEAHRPFWIRTRLSSHFLHWYPDFFAFHFLWLGWYDIVVQSKKMDLLTIDWFPICCKWRVFTVSLNFYIFWISNSFWIKIELEILSVKV